MRATLVGVLVVGGISFLAGAASAAQIVPWALRTTIDSDGDGIADLFDNAPGFFDVSQIDTDADGIGDVIDPTPINSNPNLGDPGLGEGGPYTIGLGAHAFIDYLMILAEPPGQWGHIDLDFGGNGIYDATYFGPLTFSVNLIDIPPSLFVDSTWNLNMPGSYTLFAKAFGPGRSSQFETITGVNVVPEPATLAMLALAGLALLGLRRCRN